MFPDGVSRWNCRELQTALLHLNLICSWALEKDQNTSEFVSRFFNNLVISSSIKCLNSSEAALCLSVHYTMFIPACKFKIEIGFILKNFSHPEVVQMVQITSDTSHSGEFLSQSAKGQNHSNMLSVKCTFKITHISPGAFLSTQTI